MSVSVDVDVDIKKARRKLGSEFNKAIDKAARRALTRTATSTKGKAVKLVAKASGLKAKRIKRQIRLNISKTTLIAVIKPSSRGTNLIEFMTPAAIKRAKMRKQRRRGLRVTPPGQGIKAKMAGKPVFKAGAFIAKGRVSGKTLVFVRENEGRQSALKAVSGLKIEDVFQGKLRTLEAHAREMFKKEFNRNIKFALSKLKL